MMMSGSQQQSRFAASMRETMTELELTVEELEAMDIRAVMSIEISDIWLEMLTAEKDQDPERMAAAIARLEHLEAATGTAQDR
jgi:hypothetical protein